MSKESFYTKKLRKLINLHFTAKHGKLFFRMPFALGKDQLLEEKYQLLEEKYGLGVASICEAEDKRCLAEMQKETS